MIVQCPECSSRYLLAESLLGPEGARVRCPACRGRFDVTWPREIPLAAFAGSAWAGLEHAVSAPDLDRQLDAAVAMLEPEAPRIRAAQERGALFSEAGSVLHAALAAYRSAAGARANDAAFRSELRRRWGIDLPEAANAPSLALK